MTARHCPLRVPRGRVPRGLRRSRVQGVIARRAAHRKLSCAMCREIYERPRVHCGRGAPEAGGHPGSGRRGGRGGIETRGRVWPIVGRIRPWGYRVPRNGVPRPQDIAAERRKITGWHRSATPVSADAARLQNLARGQALLTTSGMCMQGPMLRCATGEDMQIGIRSSDIRTVGTAHAVGTGRLMPTPLQPIKVALCSAASLSYGSGEEAGA